MPLDFPPGKPRKSRLISPLSRHIPPHFSHALGGLSAGDTLPAVRAVNSPVRAGRKERTTHTTTAHILHMVIPVYDDAGELVRYNVFKARRLVRHAKDGKLYLYDILRTKKETSRPLEQ